MALVPSTTDVADILSTQGLAVYICRHTLPTKTLNPIRGFESIPIPSRAEGNKIPITGIGDTAPVELAGRDGSATVSATMFLLKTDVGQKAMKAAYGTKELVTFYMLAAGGAEPTLITNTLTDPAASAANRYVKWIGQITQFSATGEQENVLKVPFAMSVASIDDKLHEP